MPHYCGFHFLSVLWDISRPDSARWKPSKNEPSATGIPRSDNSLNQPCRDLKTALATATATPDTEHQFAKCPVPEKNAAMNLFAKLGAVTYVLWGLLHIQAARLVYVLGQTLEPGIVQARIYQGAWNLLFFALFGIAVAVVLNWKNSRLGYWLNLVVISIADIGFIITILLPGYVPLVPAGLGPLLWIIAVIFSTL